VVSISPDRRFDTIEDLRSVARLDHSVSTVTQDGCDETSHVDVVFCDQNAPGPMGRGLGKAARARRVLLDCVCLHRLAPAFSPRQTAPCGSCGMRKVLPTRCRARRLVTSAPRALKSTG